MSLRASMRIKLKAKSTLKLMNLGYCYQLTESSIKDNPIKRLGQERPPDRLSGDMERGVGSAGPPPPAQVITHVAV